MDALVKKLNFKNHKDIIILNLPESLVEIKNTFAEISNLHATPQSAECLDFALVFVFNPQQIADAIMMLEQKLVEDSVLWFSYPKKSSKKFKCEIDRDHGWTVLGEHGYEPVRQVAVDEDFSALRFRKVHHIKSFTRNKEMALSEAGKNRK